MGKPAGHWVKFLPSRYSLPNPSAPPTHTLLHTHPTPHPLAPYLTCMVPVTYLCAPFSTEWHLLHTSLHSTQLCQCLASCTPLSTLPNSHNSCASSHSLIHTMPVTHSDLCLLPAFPDPWVLHTACALAHSCNAMQWISCIFLTHPRTSMHSLTPSHLSVGVDLQIFAAFTVDFDYGKPAGSCIA